MSRLALFDCDGTLIDSQASICAAMSEACRAHGVVPPPSVAIRRIVGLSVPEAVAALLPEVPTSVRSAVAGEYKHAFHALRTRGLVNEPLFDGIADVLDGLTKAGWVLGVATGKSDRGLGLALAHHGIADRFVTLQTADRHPSKPHPGMALTAMAEAGVDPAATVVIGDTSFDMAMARNAGAAAVGVAWGYHGQDELIAAGAFAIAERPCELVELLEAA